MKTHGRYTKCVIVALLCVLGFGTYDGNAHSANAGHIMGSVVFSQDDGSDTPRFAAKVKVEIERNGKTFEIKSNELGDFTETFTAGKYCLKAVKTKNDDALIISASQHRCFKIRNDKTLRFDIVLQVRGE